MSNIYIQEPPTSGKVLLKTTVGDIDIELWARECPKACRNFIQLCMEGYYNNTIFHRLVKGFIVQGGDPNADGSGGESIYGAPFKNEFHSRLRYARRGLVGMANCGADDNTSQFFFTFAPTPELQNKNTLFGKVTGDTIYNMLKLEEGVVDHQERPMYTHRITSTEVLSNPFNDIVPRAAPKPVLKVKKKQKQGVKNFGLLSFGEEAEGDEQETTIFVKQNAGKAKSLHDATDDPKLSKEPIKVPPKPGQEEHLADDCADDNDDDDEDDDAKGKTNHKNYTEIIKNKLAKRSKSMSSRAVAKPKPNDVELDEDGDEDVLLTREQEQNLKISKEKLKIREEIVTLKKQYQMDKISKEKTLLSLKANENSDKEVSQEAATDNHYINDFIQSKEKYTEKTKLKLKGQVRESFTLELLSKFRSKLDNLKQKCDSPSDDAEQQQPQLDDVAVEKEICGDDWLAHTLNFNSAAPVLAKDASTKGDDWYDVYDPRNPLNKRKRSSHNGSASSSKNNKFAKRNT